MLFRGLSDPLPKIAQLQLAGLPYGRRVQIIGVAQVQVMRAVRNHDGHQGLGHVVRHPAGRPRVQTAVTGTDTTSRSDFRTGLHFSTNNLTGYMFFFFNPEG